jgi:hypothetical protein
MQRRVAPRRGGDGDSSIAAASSRPNTTATYFYRRLRAELIKRLTLDRFDGHVTGLFNFEPPDGAPDGPCRRHRASLRRSGRGAVLRRPRLLRYDGQVGVSKIRRIRFVSSNLPPIVVASAAPTVGLRSPRSEFFPRRGHIRPRGQCIVVLVEFRGRRGIDFAEPRAYLRDQRTLHGQADGFGRQQQHTVVLLLRSAWGTRRS